MNFLLVHTHVFRCTLLKFPLKNIPGIVNLIFLHLRSMCPKTSLDKSYRCILMPFSVNAEPNVTLRRHFIHKFEERTWLQQLIADLVLDEGQKMKKICVVYLRVTEHIPESVGQGCFNFEQGLQSNLVDLLEGMPIDIRKILNLQLFDQVSIGFWKVHLLQSPICINMKILGH